MMPPPDFGYSLDMSGEVVFNTWGIEYSFEIKDIIGGDCDLVENK